MKRGGAVNVFLTIVLVPVLVITCLFVDVSRAKLGRGVVDSAGDLTLNTMLTNYDVPLNDYYGMLASAQNYEEFTAIANDYFMACLTSRGLDTSEAETYTADIMALFDDNISSSEIVDLLQMSTTSDGEYTVTPMDNGTLENPALIKKEIVEFMKYRAPIDGIAALIDKLKENKNTFDNVEKDAELTEAKQDFLESEEDLMENLLNAYDQILNYENLGFTEEYIKEMTTYLNGMEDIYRQSHYKMVMDLYNTEDLGGYDPEKVVLDPSINPDSVSASGINGYINNAANSIQDFYDLKDSLNNAYGTVPSYQSNSNTYYHVQCWKQLVDVMQQNKCYAKFVSKANAMISNCRKLEIAYGKLEDEEKEETYYLKNYGDVNAAGNASRSTHYSNIISQYDSLRSTYIANGACGYDKMTNELGYYRSDFMELLDNSQVNADISAIYSKINEYDKKLEDAEKYLKNANDYLEKTPGLLKTCRDNYAEWKSVIDSYGGSPTPLAEEDLEEWTKFETDVLDAVTDDNITELKNRLNNIHSLLGNVRKAIDEYEYNGTKVKKIDDYQTFKKKSGVKADNISFVISELNSYKESSFIFTTSTVVGTINVTNNNNPSLTVNPPELYTWMIKYPPFKKYAEAKKNGQTVEGSKKEGEDKKDEAEGEVDDAYDEDAADEVAASENNISELENLPSSNHSTPPMTATISKDITEMSNVVSGMFTDFGGTVTQSAVNLRDDVYTIDYIMNMFSYQTFENEWKFENSTNVTMAGFNSGNPYADADEGFKSTDLTFPYNKTLTNKMIDSTNNYAYGSEVEYILYGKSNEDNLKSANRTIFAIRFILNLPAEFKRYWPESVGVDDKGCLSEMALLAESLSYGIVPAKLVKFVVIMGLAAAESATDLKILKKGIPVKLVKNENELEMHFPSAEGIWVKENDVRDKNLSMGFQYSDYLKLFLFLKLTAGDSDGIYLRTMDVIQANMIHQGNEFVASKSVVYYQANATVQVAPLMLDIPLVTNEGYGATNGAWNTINYSQVKGY